MPSETTAIHRRRSMRMDPPRARVSGQWRTLPGRKDAPAPDLKADGFEAAPAK